MVKYTKSGVLKVGASQTQNQQPLDSAGAQTRGRVGLFRQMAVSGGFFTESFSNPLEYVLLFHAPNILYVHEKI